MPRPGPWGWPCRDEWVHQPTVRAYLLPYKDLEGNEIHDVWWFWHCCNRAYVMEKRRWPEREPITIEATEFNHGIATYGVAWIKEFDPGRRFGDRNIGDD